MKMIRTIQHQIHADIMDDKRNKRYNFLPSNIEQIEKETIASLCETDDRYGVHESFKGKKPSPWELLHTHYPANSSIRDAADLLFQLNYRGCPLYYTCMQCECPNCTEMKPEFIPYALSTCTNRNLDAVATSGKVRAMPHVEFYLIRPNESKTY